MNFYQHQDDAHKNTGRLILLFSLAVLGLIVLTNLFVTGVIWGFDDQMVGRYQSYAHMNYNAEHGFISTLSWDRFFKVALWVAGTIGLVILFKWRQLRGGGRVVAERMGGKPVLHNTGNFEERQLLNVVEEMAIAAGMPVPPVYLMEEPGINAFAAGYQPGDAVIGITRGALQALSRDQLQGVFAHEFSHILHGDIRINMRLIAVLAGIIFIGQAGQVVLHSSSRASLVSSSSKNGNSLPFMAIGLGLLVIGYIGLFFGNLIKAAVSRQREFLADASAVQYTRNPEGVAGALKVIGGSAVGSLLSTRRAEENSHLFFGNALTHKVRSAFATHPPLDERIRRIDPDWDGRFFQQREAAQTETPETSSIVANAAVAASAALVDQVSHAGELNKLTVSRVHSLMASLPNELKAASQDSYYARALIFALLLDRENSAVREKQLALLEPITDLRRHTEELLPFIKLLQPYQRLPLVELAVPALKQQSFNQYLTFTQLLKQLIDADETIELFEWMLQRLVHYYLEGQYGKPGKARKSVGSLRLLDIECYEVLSLLAYRGHGNFHDAEFAYQQAIFVMELGPTILIDEAQLSYERIDNALTKLSCLRPKLKEEFLKACAVCIEADKQVTDTERELMRVIGALLNCPMPATQF